MMATVSERLCDGSFRDHGREQSSAYRELARHPCDDQNDGECGICGLPSESTWDPIRAAWTMTVGDCGEDRQVLEFMQ